MRDICYRICTVLTAVCIANGGQGWVAAQEADTSASPSSGTTPVSKQEAGHEEDAVATAETIRDWIEDLSSDSYARRQFAILKIHAQAEAALPAVVGWIRSPQANNDKVEPLIQFLAVLASKPNTAAGKEAYETLQELANVRTSSKAMLAQRVLDVIGREQSDLAVNQLRDLHAYVVTREFQVMTTPNKLKRDALIINDTFTGAPEDLECIRWISPIFFVRLEGIKINRRILEYIVTLPNLSELQIIRTELSYEDLAVLERAPDLKLLEIRYTPLDDRAIDVLSRIPVTQDVHLFGMNMTKEGGERLKEKLDGVNIFVSRGGFLGISCDPFGLRIQSVEAGGPAERAGIMTGDRLLKINNEEIFVFEDLRKQLAKYAPGETVEVEYRRRWTDGTVTSQVVLGANNK